MKSRLIVCAVIRNGNKVLLGKKPKGKCPYPNTWHLPGGGINLEKESCEDAVVREIKEETGLDVKDLKKYKLNKPTKILFKKLGWLRR